MRILFVILTMAFAASLGAQSLEAARSAIFREDFSAARAELNAAPESPERLALGRVLDECELAAACEKAEIDLEQRKKAETLTALSKALASCPLAQASRQRAIGLLAIARSTDTAALEQHEAFLKQLESKIEDDEQVVAKRKEYVKKITDGVEKSMDDARAAYLAAHKARTDKRVSTAIEGYENARKLVADAARALTFIEPYVDPKEYASHQSSIETRAKDVRVEAALGLGWVHFELRSYEKAAREAEAGLRLAPGHKELIDLRVRTEEFWKQLFDPKEPK
ncbi:MAG: hypothetical protein L6Q71_02040 [Planctomycetes bacterium]|nr:hypothetical protein [Planctomycetota bacterium]NUQ34340.1 hypothetical protein [Planctomycetaceae bacterium]